MIALDDQRKSSQTQRDQLQAESNSISKQIGVLMKNGQREEAEKVKSRTAELKTEIKALEDSTTQAEEDLKALLYTIPNIPHLSVPAGKSADDNEVVLENGVIPTLHEDRLPHWELIKKIRYHRF